MVYKLEGNHFFAIMQKRNFMQLKAARVIVLNSSHQNAMYGPYFLRPQQTAEALGRKFPSLIYQMINYE